MRRLLLLCLLSVLFGTSVALATIFSQVHGIVHDPQHRPIAGARVEVRARALRFRPNGCDRPRRFVTLASVPLGDYTVTVSQAGFEKVRQMLTLASDTAPILHFELQVGSVQQTVTVESPGQTANVNTVTPTTLIGRPTSRKRPAPTAPTVMGHDHRLRSRRLHDPRHAPHARRPPGPWLIDGVQIPNTNIASNLAAQIDPKDIDYLEIQRGSYTSDIGDRTYGVFNVVPRTGFERDRQAELVLPQAASPDQ